MTAEGTSCRMLEAHWPQSLEQFVWGRALADFSTGSQNAPPHTCMQAMSSKRNAIISSRLKFNFHLPFAFLYLVLALFNSVLIRVSYGSAEVNDVTTEQKKTVARDCRNWKKRTSIYFSPLLSISPKIHTSEHLLTVQRTPLSAGYLMKTFFALTNGRNSYFRGVTSGRQRGSLKNTW